MGDKDTADKTGTYHLYGELTNKLEMTGTFHQLQLDKEDPDPFEAASVSDARVSWTRRLLNWLRGN